MLHGPNEKELTVVGFFVLISRIDDVPSLFVSGTEFLESSDFSSNDFYFNFFSSLVQSGNVQNRNDFLRKNLASSKKLENSF